MLFFVLISIFPSFWQNHFPSVGLRCLFHTPYFTLFFLSRASWTSIFVCHLSSRQTLFKAFTMKGVLILNSMFRPLTFIDITFIITGRLLSIFPAPSLVPFVLAKFPSSLPDNRSQRTVSPVCNPINIAIKINNSYLPYFYLHQRRQLRGTQKNKTNEKKAL